MQLTRAAATRALAAAEAEAAHPTPASTHPATPDAASPIPRTPDPNLAFARLASAVRQAVKLEAQIAAGVFTRAPAATAHPELDVAALNRAADHGLLSSGLRRLTETHPDRYALHETIQDTIEETLADHPEDPLPTHFARACQILGLTPDFSSFPDHLVEFLHPAPPTTHHQPAWPAPDG